MRNNGLLGRRIVQVETHYGLKAGYSLALARILETECCCDVCRRRPAIGIFDRCFVCKRCRGQIERRLGRYG